jgi:hypothetical protein
MRPFLLLASNFYNFCLNCKNLEKEERKLRKKYKDDVAWQAEEAERMKDRYINGKLVVVPPAQKQQLRCEDSAGMLALRHIELFFISYSGFARFLLSDERYSFSITLSNTYEVFVQGVPLCLLQYYNNLYLNKPLALMDTLNIVMSGLNAIDLVVEVLLAQLLDRHGGKYHIIKSECAEEEEKKRKKTKQEKKLEKEKKMKNMAAKSKEIALPVYETFHQKCTRFFGLPEFVLILAIVSTVAISGILWNTIDEG